MDQLKTKFKEITLELHKLFKECQVVDTKLNDTFRNRILCFRDSLKAEIEESRSNEENWKNNNYTVISIEQQGFTRGLDMCLQLLEEEVLGENES
jgi:Skp family chaperone for outer membrane proteins